MRVGLSGSRDGLTIAQRTRFFKRMQPLGLLEIHYGDCIGADEDMLLILATIGYRSGFHAHPATMNPEWDARWVAHTADKYPELGITEYPALAPITRNHVIVNSVDLLIACPATEDRNAKSGTWATIRYAQGKVPMVVIAPDGREIK